MKLPGRTRKRDRAEVVLESEDEGGASDAALFYRLAKRTSNGTKKERFGDPPGDFHPARRRRPRQRAEPVRGALTPRRFRGVRPPQEKRALERGHGITGGQEQVTQFIMEVAGMPAAQADELRQAFPPR